MKYIKKLGACAVIFFVLATMIKQQLPMNTKFFKLIYVPIELVEKSMGTNQSWQMFSPNPSKMDAYVIADIEYVDGTKSFYDFNKYNDHSMLEKYLFGEKYRKYVGEHLRTDNKKFLWNDGLDFAIYKLSSIHGNKEVKKATLTRFWSETPSINKEFISHEELKGKYNSYIFLTRGNGK